MFTLLHTLSIIYLAISSFNNALSFVLPCVCYLVYYNIYLGDLASSIACSYLKVSIIYLVLSSITIVVLTNYFALSTILREKSLAIIYNGVSHR